MFYPPLSPNREIALIVLESCQVLFLAIHDWIPLGRLNDVSAVRQQDTTTRLVLVTLIQTVPFAFGLWHSVSDFGPPYPGWLMQWLFISYLILFLGQLRAWWVPYLLRPEPERANRYRIMFARTHLLSTGAQRNNSEHCTRLSAFSDIRNVVPSPHPLTGGPG